MKLMGSAGFAWPFAWDFPKWQVPQASSLDGLCWKNPIEMDDQWGSLLLGNHHLQTSSDFAMRDCLWFYWNSWCGRNRVIPTRMGDSARTQNEMEKDGNRSTVDTFCATMKSKWPTMWCLPVVPKEMNQQNCCDLSCPMSLVSALIGSRVPLFSAAIVL